jgi:arsenate reductase
MFHRPRVLFICVHNGGGSQMCEAFLNHYAGDRFDAHSAGLEPGDFNPLAVAVMAEIGIDISQNKTKSVFDVWKSGETFQYVVGVCDAESAEKCPIFPRITKRLHWPFHGPSKVTGKQEQKLQKVCQIRDKIAAKIQDWLASLAVEQPA